MGTYWEPKKIEKKKNKSFPPQTSKEKMQATFDAFPLAA